MWIRLIPIVFFSMTALSLIAFQSLEIIHAFFDFITHKTDI
ncbi:hypothetical protein [Heyndrickxia camelliae]|nr:hypothetical protein [Heyndrickxia camelliae]